MNTRQDFASDEEWDMHSWLQEAEAHGLVSDVVYQPGPFELAPRASVKVTERLKTKIKQIDKFLFHPHRFTPDFSFLLVSDAILSAFKHPQACQHGHQVVIDVKGAFNKFGDQKQFAINQKWVWAKFGVYVEKVVPEDLFKKTWVPSVCRLTPKKRQPVKKYIGVPTIDEFLEKHHCITEHQKEMF